MRKKEIVLVDMDGVLEDFDGATAVHLAEYHPNITIAERASFYFRDDYQSPADQAMIDSLHASQGFFASLPPVDGALEGWERLHELGYEPQVCSSPLRVNEWCEDEKRAWLGRYLGKTVADAAVITSAKNEYDGIALIDDRPAVRGAETASWQHVLFDAQYNRNVSTELRISDWGDERLPDVIARAAVLSQLRKR